MNAMHFSPKFQFHKDVSGNSDYTEIWGDFQVFKLLNLTFNNDLDMCVCIFGTMYRITQESYIVILN